MRTLEQQVREYYESQTLSEERVQSMLEVGRAVTPPARLAWVAGAAAVIALFAVILFAVNRPVQADLTGLVIAEIAKNHSKQLAPEVVSDRYEEVQAKLGKLDFSIVPASEFLRRDFQLEGGRYCSVQSEFAAQLKMREFGGDKSCTLYVAPLTAVLRSVKPDTRVVNGVRVQVWVEDGRLFGLARDATPAASEQKGR